MEFEDYVRDRQLYLQHFLFLNMEEVVKMLSFA